MAAKEGESVITEAMLKAQEAMHRSTEVVANTIVDLFKNAELIAQNFRETLKAIGGGKGGSDSSGGSSA